MLRGAIESVTKTSIAGWIYTAEAELRGRPILAFVDNQCVGAGDVSLYRQDLADAGLGHGFLGFRFPISLNDDVDLDSVMVRLEGSDAALLPAGSRLVSATSFTTKPRLVTPRKTSCLQWMRGRGWLEQHEFDYLTFLDQAGVYECVLTPSTRQLANNIMIRDHFSAARDLLEIHYMSNVEVSHINIDSLSDLTELFFRLHPPVGDDVVVALQALEPTRIRIIDGSHRKLSDIEETSFLGTEYTLQQDRLIILNKLVAFEPQSPSPNSGITVFYAN